MKYWYIEKAEVSMQRADYKFIFALTFVILGIVISLQVRSIVSANIQKAVSPQHVEYQKQLDAEKLKVDKLNREIEKLEGKLQQYLENKDEYRNNSYGEALKQQIANAGFKAGLTDVKGMGVIITLDDAPAREVENANLQIIHDSDVNGILNVLKKAGAQAISINDERLIPMSEIVCAGPTIKINKNRHAVPFVIKAIGDPDKMYDAFTEYNLIPVLVQYKIRVNIEKSEDIIVKKLKLGDRSDYLTSGLEVVE